MLQDSNATYAGIAIYRDRELIFYADSEQYFGGRRSVSRP